VGRVTGEKKTVLTSHGSQELGHGHPFSGSIKSFKISPLLQEMALYSGQHCVYEGASDLLSKCLQVEVSAKQIERLVHHYGPQVSEALDHFHSTRKRERRDWEATYVMMDGSMILTREDSWKEVKLARIFSHCGRVQASPGRNWIRDSWYVAHLGSLHPFLRELGNAVDKLADPVFINDGAPWIWAWIEQYYPDSVQILDFYHAAEYLWDFAKEHFREEAQRKGWVERQKKLLLKDQVGRVIRDIEQMKAIGKKGRQQKQRLLRYYQTHRKRMMYGTCRKDGLLIGSGPIESAHRTVIQERLKKSGQRWTVPGAQAIIPLRVAQKSGLWGIVEKTITNHAA
jgi:Uncharacterised protein family (UPF0236)